MVIFSVIFFLLLYIFFGHLVFYLLATLDSVYWTSSIEKKCWIKMLLAFKNFFLLLYIFFGHLVFYLLATLDSVYWTSSIEKKAELRCYLRSKTFLIKEQLWLMSWSRVGSVDQIQRTKKTENHITEYYTIWPNKWKTILLKITIRSRTPWSCGLSRQPYVMN